MWSMIRPALVSLGMLTLITGVAYPLVVTGIAQAAFSDQAHGSILMRDGKAVGSELVGQPFADPGFFWGRPSATGPHGYNGAASSGSNAGPTNPALGETVAERVKVLRDADPGNDAPVPVDLVTASGSGLDPHISPAAAAYQVARVARARGVEESVVRKLVDANTEGRQLGILGEPRVNVVRLNLALEALK